MASPSINIIGKVTNVAEADAQRLAAFVLRCNHIIVSSAIQADGTYHLSLPRTALKEESPFGFDLVVAPATAGSHLEHLPNVTRIALKRPDLEKSEKEYRVANISIASEILKLWWTWCRWYCVSGTVVGPDGCAVPGADVTVYSVYYTGGGYSKVPRATVNTGANGTFTACFEWCSCIFCFPCWPCWPHWYLCWPWWWEWDILHVIEALERIPQPGLGQIETLSSQATLLRPDARALMRGQGFAHYQDNFAADANRTALIKAKLANPRIREIFPWWWWCCDDPNIVFSVTQNGNVILDENPAVATRWCFEDGSNVTLVGNDDSITLCHPHCPPESGFVWTNVGNIDVNDISQGYATVPAWTAADPDYQDLVFGGGLDLFGSFAPGSNVSFYQVTAGQWSGNPARGGTAPTSTSLLQADLYRTAIIEDPTHTIIHFVSVKMGPFTQNGVSGLYATEAARAAGPIAGLPNIPLPPGWTVFGFSQPGLMVSTSSQNLIAGATSGAVDLTVLGYDAAVHSVTLVPDYPLTLMIDNTPLTTDAISIVNAFRADGSLAPLTGTNQCPAYNVGPGGYVQISTSVSDSMGHLFGYYVDAEYGSGSAVAVTPPGVRGYVTNPLSSGAPQTLPPACGGDPNYTCKSWVGGSETMYFPNGPGGTNWTPPFSLTSEPPDCCYEFRIRLAKRSTNGYSLPSLADGQFQTVALKFS
ncbi:MAG TPA: carboxypeptidase-like regulatory domain-containing protein [Terriglobales bacterium]|nr:carboxypeptidase-like regulatory domain-containing protein [Terriglobales bacterium]